MAVKKHDRMGFATNLLEQIHAAEQRLNELRRKHKLDVLEEEISIAKKALAQVMADQGYDQVTGDGFHATLVRSVKSRAWLLTREEAAALGEDRKSLREIVRKKYGPLVKGSRSMALWQMITRRMADPEGIEAAISRGLLTLDDVAPAYVEEDKTPFVRIYEDS